MGGLVGRRRHVAGVTELSLRLFKQTVILTAVRIVAFGASAAVGHVTIDWSVFIEKRPGLLGMTILASGGKSKHLILIGAFYKSVATQAGNCPGTYRMRTAARKLCHSVLMALAAEVGVVVHKERRSVSVNFVAGGAVGLQRSMGVKAVIVQIAVRRMAGIAGVIRRVAMQVRRVYDCPPIGIVQMFLPAGMAGDASDFRCWFSGGRRQSVRRSDESFIYIGVALKAGSILRRIDSSHRRNQDRSGCNCKQDKRQS